MHCLASGDYREHRLNTEANRCSPAVWLQTSGWCLCGGEWGKKKLHSGVGSGCDQRGKFVTFAADVTIMAVDTTNSSARTMLTEKTLLLFECCLWKQRRRSSCAHGRITCQLLTPGPYRKRHFYLSDSYLKCQKDTDTHSSATRHSENVFVPSM